jgi:hypothetical protein
MKGGKGAVFKAVSVGVSYPQKYDFIEGALYMVNVDDPRAGDNVLRLYRISKKLE